MLQNTTNKKTRYSSRVKKIIVLAIVVSLLVPLTVFAQANSGFSLVPCGNRGDDPCKFIDLIFLIVNIINFLLAASALVAMYYVLFSGWSMMTSLGNPEKIMAAKTGLEKALVGFAIVLLSFAFVNLLILGIFGVKCPVPWWEIPTELFKPGSCFVP